MNWKLKAFAAGLMIAAASPGAGAYNYNYSGDTDIDIPADSVNKGGYFYLTAWNGNQGTLFVSGDSLQLKRDAKTLPAYQREYGLWKIDWTTDVSGERIYNFTNKATGQPLTLPTSGKATAFGGTLTNFAWGNKYKDAGVTDYLRCQKEDSEYEAYSLMPVYYVTEDIEIDNVNATLLDCMDKVLEKSYVQLQVVPRVYMAEKLHKDTDWKEVGTYFDTEWYSDDDYDYGAWYTYKYFAENPEDISIGGYTAATFKQYAESYLAEMKKLKPDLDYTNLERAINALEGATTDLADALSDVVAAVRSLNVWGPYMWNGAKAPVLAGYGDTAENSGLIYLPGKNILLSGAGKTIIKKGSALIISADFDDTNYKGQIMECEPLAFSACVCGDMDMMAWNEVWDGTAAGSYVGPAIEIHKFSPEGTQHGVQDDADKDGKFFAKHFLNEFMTGEEGEDLTKVSTTIDVTGMRGFETVLDGKNIQIVMRNLLISGNTGLGKHSSWTEQNLQSYSKATMIYDGEGKYLVVDTLTYEEGYSESIHYKLAWATLDSVAKCSMDGGVTGSGLTVADTTGTAAKFWKPTRGEKGGYHAAAYVWNIVYNVETSEFVIKPAFNVRKGSATYFSADTVGSADGTGGKLMITENKDLVVSPYNFSMSTELTLIKGKKPTSPMIASKAKTAAKEYKMTQPKGDVYYVQYLTAGAKRDSSAMFITATPGLKSDYTGFEYMPETQWVLITDSIAKRSSILNRATGEALSFHGLTYNSVQLFDATSATLKSDDAVYVSLMGGDTLKLTSLPTAVKMDSLVGYKAYIKNVTKYSKYKLTYYNNLNATKEVGMTEDSTLAVNLTDEGAWFQLESVAFGSYGAPAIEGVSKKLYKTAYRLKTIVDGEELYVVEHDGTYAAIGKDAAGAATFDLKTELYADGKLWYVMYENRDTANTTYGYKASVDDSSLKLFKESTNEIRTSMFALAELPAPEYRRLGKTVEDGINDMDTAYVEIFMAKEPQRCLFENTLNTVADNGTGVKADSLNYLGIYNKSDRELNASIFVDTAYVRGETHKPLYMLAMGVKYTAGSTVVNECLIHGKDCEHTTIVITKSKSTGRYLVALPSDTTDHNASAKYQGKARMAFVGATHMGDSLIIDRSMYSADAKTLKKDSLVIEADTMNAATFAFKMVEGDEGDFVIEAVDGQFVRIHNGVPVLVDNEAQAAIFNIRKATETPTANESIAAGGIKVIAGEGYVTIKGAAGKKVVIANVLGQTIANTVASSDEARIATPRGVVVVAVEGAVAQKAIVK